MAADVLQSPHPLVRFPLVFGWPRNSSPLDPVLHAVDWRRRRRPPGLHERPALALDLDEFHIRLTGAVGDERARATFTLGTA